MQKIQQSQISREKKIKLEDTCFLIVKLTTKAQ